MGEKGSGFIHSLATFIFHAAKDKGIEQETAEGLVSMHQLNGSGKRKRPAVDILSDEVNALVLHESDMLAPVIKKKYPRGAGEVNLRSIEADSAAQTLAEEVDRMVSQDVYENLPDVKGKRVLKEITDEIIKRNNW